MIGRPSMPVLRDVLRSGGWEGEDRPAAYHNAVTALVMMGEGLGKEEIAPDLVDALNGTDTEAEGAARVLWSLGPPAAAVPAPIECLSANWGSWLRWAAARALGEVGVVSEAVPALASVLNDDMGWARAAAAEALGNMGEAARPAIPALGRVARGKDESVARAAKAALKKIREVPESKLPTNRCP